MNVSSYETAKINDRYFYTYDSGQHNFFYCTHETETIITARRIDVAKTALGGRIAKSLDWASNGVYNYLGTNDDVGAAVHIPRANIKGKAVRICDYILTVPLPVFLETG